MADRFPLIANSSNNQIQELASGDTLDLTGNSVKGAGIITATTFSGALDGNATTATNASGLSGTPELTVSTLTGVAGTFTGNLSIEGQLTYEDVTNVDSIGVITARSGIVVNNNGVTLGTGATIDSSATGIVSVTRGASLAIPTVPGTNTNANLGILFQTLGGVIDGGSGLTWNPAGDSLSVNGTTIANNFINGSGSGPIKLSVSNHSSTQFIEVSDHVELRGNVGVNTDNPDTNFVVDGTARMGIVDLGTQTGNVVLNFSNSNNFKLTMGGNLTFGAPTGITTGQSGVITLVQDGTGSRTASWDGAFMFKSGTAPTLSTGVGKTDCIAYYCFEPPYIVAGTFIGIGTQ